MMDVQCTNKSLPARSIPHSLDELGVPVTAAPTTTEAAVEVEHRYRNRTFSD